MTKQTTIVVIGALSVKGTSNTWQIFCLFAGETTFVISSLLYCNQVPSEKGSTLKGMNVLLLGTNSFLSE